MGTTDRREAVAHDSLLSEVVAIRESRAHSGDNWRIGIMPLHDVLNRLVQLRIRRRYGCFKGQQGLNRDGRVIDHSTQRPEKLLRILVSQQPAVELRDSFWWNHVDLVAAR